MRESIAYALAVHHERLIRRVQPWTARNELIFQNHCRRMKMRCIGAEEPPCKRCKNAGLDCVMEKPKSTNPTGEGDE
jgi:hypothetical protein